MKSPCAEQPHLVEAMPHRETGGETGSRETKREPSLAEKVKSRRVPKTVFDEGMDQETLRIIQENTKQFTAAAMKQSGPSHCTFASATHFFIQ
eukprot:COSAG03_NODE_4002_length_1725_cov_1.476630_1_plen_92_part_10